MYSWAEIKSEFSDIILHAEYVHVLNGKWIYIEVLSHDS